MSSATELGPQLPLIHVETPNRGNTHLCKTNQPAKTAAAIKNSIDMSPYALNDA